MKVHLIVLSFLFLSLAHASDIDQKTGNIRYNYLDDERTGNFSIKEWPRDCGRFSEIRDEAGKDAIKRCEAASGGKKCVLDNDSSDAVSLTALTEEDRDLVQSFMSRRISVSIDPDAYYFSFNYETEQWFLTNCPQAIQQLLTNITQGPSRPNLGRVEGERSSGKDLNPSMDSTGADSTPVSNQ